MNLDKDVLGLAVYNVRKSFSDKTLDELIMMYGSLDNARLAESKAEMEVIINHFKLADILGTGLTAGPYPVTGITHLT